MNRVASLPSERVAGCRKFHAWESYSGHHATNSHLGVILARLKSWHRRSSPTASASARGVNPHPRNLMNVTTPQRRPHLRGRATAFTVAACSLALGTTTLAQTAAQEETIQLSEFTVRGSQDIGWRA